MLTRNKIELDIKSSNYTFEYEDNIFFFSSEFYLNKFKTELPDYVYSESIKLKNKYKLNISCNLFLAISLYRKIEKRGFYIFNKNKKLPVKEDSLFFINILQFE